MKILQTTYTTLCLAGCLTFLPAHCLRAATPDESTTRTFQLGDKQIDWTGVWNGQQLSSATILDRINSGLMHLNGPSFEIQLGNGKTIASSDFTATDTPEIKPLKINTASPKMADHDAGKEFTVDLSDAAAHLTATWSVRLRSNANYLREKLVLRTTGTTQLIKQIVLLHQSIPGAHTVGNVEGSPVVAGNYFFGYENPMAENTVDNKALVQCAFMPYAILKPGDTYSGSCVIGVAPRGQLRHGFMAYLDMERCHPYRPFLHYNSWYDIGGKYNQAQCIHAINRIGTELVLKRGVKLKSFLFDDGWDDNKTLWEFNKGFPNGFTPLNQAAARYQAGVGVWLSPWGGYSKSKDQRLKYGRLHGFEIKQYGFDGPADQSVHAWFALHGFEINQYGFDMAGPKYYHRFSNICMQMIKKYNVNIFKFDGLAAGKDNPVLIREGDAMLQLDSDLRKAEPNLYISQTTGTWASPFWLLYADSIWRQGTEHSFEGVGSSCQQWMTYRDAQTFRNIVQKGPLYPLNSLMLHGIIYGRRASRLNKETNQDFADQVWSFFGTGTQLQELYITPHLLNNYDWNVLARAAKWANANAEILSDTHWIGGDPAKGQVYGWASWHANHGILVLRNPTADAATFTADIGKLFQLPAGAKTSYRLVNVQKHPAGQVVISLHAGDPHIFTLQPFQVLVLDTGPY